MPFSPIPPAKLANLPKSNTASSTAFSSETPPAAPDPHHKPNTVSSPTPPAQPAYLPQLEDKLQFLKECIEQVEDQLTERQKQKQDFISELEQKICEVQSDIYDLDQLGHIQNNQLSKRRINMDKEIKRLEMEIRQQELEYWRDVTELQKELRQLRKEYRAVRQSVNAICSEQTKS